MRKVTIAATGAVAAIALTPLLLSGLPRAADSGACRSKNLPKTHQDDDNAGGRPRRALVQSMGARAQPIGGVCEGWVRSR